MFEKLFSRFRPAAAEAPEPAAQPAAPLTPFEALVQENLALGKQGDEIRARRLALQKQISESLLAQRPHKGT